MFSRALVPLTVYLSLLCAVSQSFAAIPGTVIDVTNGRLLESLTIRNAASPCVVIFEAGSRGTIANWGSVPESTSQAATIFAYNRPGYGKSEATTTPRDGRTIVEELRQNLKAKNLPPPYILVGHSLGGLYMQLFARAYPAEVKGLVLVDSLYPGMVKKTVEFPLMTRTMGKLVFSQSAWQEIEGIDKTSDLILGLGSIDDKSITRIVNAPTSKTAIPLDLGIFRTDSMTRQQVGRFYPNATTLVVDSSHQVALTSPALVTGAIHKNMSVAGCLARAAD